jgi:hypothetical protein
MVVSQNGYTANDPSKVSSRVVPGTTRRLTVRNGPAGDLLLWVAGQFDKLVEDIEQGILDDWGYAERPIRGGTELSNHASGTAIDLNATSHPLATDPAANFSRAEIDTIHAILARTRGCVRWGGDYTGRKDGMHFEIVRDEAACAAALTALTSGEEDDVTPQEIQAIAIAAAHAVWDEDVTDRNIGKVTKARELLMWGHFEAARGRAAIAGLQAALAATAKDPGITEARLAEIVDSAIERHVQITGTIEIGSKQ